MPMSTNDSDAKNELNGLNRGHEEGGRGRRRIEEDGGYIRAKEAKLVDKPK